jgi:dipeptidyl aminopeptidase/acylaminoacyl peptidase
MPFDLATFLAGLRLWAEEAGWPVETLRYGDHPEQVADLRLPDAGDARGLAVVLHGGFWRARYGRTTTAALAVDLARRGWASLNVEYRRIGCGGGVPETLDDVAAAVAAGAAQVRPRRTVVIGHSAGGHLALWAAGLPGVSAVVSLAGVADLAAAARERLGDGAALEVAGGTPEDRPEAYALADPLRRLPLPVPALLVHGDADDRVPVEQSRRYAAAAGARCELLELAGIGHFDPIDPRGEAWPQVARRLEALAG